MPKYLDFAEPGEYQSGQPVEIEVYSVTDLGYKAIVNSKHWGVIYHQEVFQDLQQGQKLQAYIKKIRDDGKIDLILYQDGNKDAQNIGEKILELLNRSGGRLSITDKTSPEEIYSKFGVSKKKFKIAMSGLYKKRLIQIDEQGISLSTSAHKKPKTQSQN